MRIQISMNNLTATWVGQDGRIMEAQCVVQTEQYAEDDIIILDLEEGKVQDARA